LKHFAFQQTCLRGAKKVCITFCKVTVIVYRNGQASAKLIDITFTSNSLTSPKFVTRGQVVRSQNVVEV